MLSVGGKNEGCSRFEGVSSVRSRAGFTLFLSRARGIIIRRLRKKGEEKKEKKKREIVVSSIDESRSRN